VTSSNYEIYSSLKPRSRGTLLIQQPNSSSAGSWDHCSSRNSVEKTSTANKKIEGKSPCVGNMYKSSTSRYSERMHSYSRGMPFDLHIKQSNSESKSAYSDATPQSLSCITQSKIKPARRMPKAQTWKRENFDFYKNHHKESSSESSSSSSDFTSSDSLNSSNLSKSRRSWSASSSSRTSRDKSSTDSEDISTLNLNLDHPLNLRSLKKSLPIQLSNSKSRANKIDEHEKLFFFVNHLYSLLQDVQKLRFFWNSLPVRIQSWILGSQVQVLCQADSKRLFQATKLLAALVKDSSPSLQHLVARQLQPLRLSSPYAEVRRCALEVLLEGGLILIAAKYHPSFKAHC